MSLTKSLPLARIAEGALGVEVLSIDPMGLMGGAVRFGFREGDDRESCFGGVQVCF